MSRKMLSRSYHPIRLDPADECCAKSCCKRRIFTIGARVDHRISRIVVHIEHRRVRNVNPESPAFYGRKLSLLERESRIAGGANRHFWWEHLCPAKIDGVRNEVPAPSPEPSTSLQVCAENQGNRAHLLKRIELGRDLGRRTHRDREPPNLLLLYIVGQVLPLRGIP